jgi:hypothetical protein
MSSGQYQATLGNQFKNQNGIAAKQYEVAKFQPGGLI